MAWTGNGGEAIVGSVEITVTPATLSGKPTFGSGEGKTLGEVKVTLPDGWPGNGTFTWEAGADTQVVRGTSYAYTYTSADGNYAASGSVILWAAPSTGGGGGGAAKATVDTSMGSEIVKQAAANSSETVVIAPKVTGDVSKTEVSIPASTVGQLG